MKQELDIRDDQPKERTISYRTSEEDYKFVDKIHKIYKKNGLNVSHGRIWRAINRRGRKGLK